MPGCREGCGLEGKLATASTVKPFKPNLTPGSQIWSICAQPAVLWEPRVLRLVLGQLFPEHYGEMARAAGRNLPSAETLCCCVFPGLALTLLKRSQPFYLLHLATPLAETSPTGHPHADEPHPWVGCSQRAPCLLPALVHRAAGDYEGSSG